MDIGQIFVNLWQSTGFVQIDWRQIIMLFIGFVLMYLAIVKKFEPLLLVGIAFGMILTNLPGVTLFTPSVWQTSSKVDYLAVLQSGRLLDIFVRLLKPDMNLIRFVVYLSRRRQLSWRILRFVALSR